MTTPNDLVLYYYGGAGGFYALHLLLLSGHYKCVFHGESQDLTDIMERQWNIHDIAQWKKTETWPKNKSTETSDIPHKVFMICQPKPEDLAKFPGDTLIVYTDADTHWDIVNTKNCGPFAGYDHQYYKNVHFVNMYNDVRADGWPNVTDLSDYDTLPDHIKVELQESFKYTPESVDLRDILFPTTKYHDTDIYEKYQTVLDIKNKKYVYSLQELIRSQGEVLYQDLGLDFNSECQKFTEHYVSLHPEHLRRRLLS